MGYNEELANRVRQAVGPGRNVLEKKMFGGVAFLLDTKMFVGVAKDDLLVRVGPTAYEAALLEPHVRPMDFTGRPLTGFVFVGPAGSRTKHAVAKWVDRAVDFVSTLKVAPRKPKRKGTSTRAKRGKR